jgi:hypothetical protein
MDFDAATRPAATAFSCMMKTYPHTGTPRRVLSTLTLTAI